MRYLEGHDSHSGGEALAEFGSAIVPRDIRMMFQALTGCTSQQGGVPGRW